MIVWMLLACGSPESEGVWMEKSGFNWALFNHRISHLEFGVDEDGAHATVVGGTSTTNVFTPLEDGCSQDTCNEFPFVDLADIQVGWARATSNSAVFGAASGDVVADADGETGEVRIELPHKAKGDATVVIRGYQFDTNHPLEGEPACYRPQNGWMPKTFGVELGEPSLAADGRSVTVSFTATFEAGPTNEDVRECLDAVVTRARVPVRVDLLAVVTKNPSESFTVNHGEAYEYSGVPSDPGEQPPPDFAERTLDVTVDNALVGWSAFNFLFHEIGEERGAYVRSLFMVLDPVDNVASGHSTNFSPATQLSEFDYQFTGTAQAVDVGAAVERGLIETQISVELDDNGVPVGSSWPLSPVE